MILLDMEREDDSIRAVIKLPVARCKHCSNEWVPRTNTPKQCPKCKSPYWNKTRVLPAGRQRASVAV